MGNEWSHRDEEGRRRAKCKCSDTGLIASSVVFCSGGYQTQPTFPFELRAAGTNLKMRFLSDEPATRSQFLANNERILIDAQGSHAVSCMYEGMLIKWGGLGMPTEPFEILGRGCGSKGTKGRPELRVEVSEEEERHRAGSEAEERPFQYPGVCRSFSLELELLSEPGQREGERIVMTL